MSHTGHFDGLNVRRQFLPVAEPAWLAEANGEPILRLCERSAAISEFLGHGQSEIAASTFHLIQHLWRGSAKICWFISSVILRRVEGQRNRMIKSIH